MNKEWHEAHKMPEEATEKQRIDWHRKHAKACGCRPIPAGLLGKMGESEELKTEAGFAKGKR